MKYTKYEKARIIGARALQISMGAPFMLKLNQNDLDRLRYSPLEIAKLEFEEELVPITVKRPLPVPEPLKQKRDRNEVREMQSISGTSSRNLEVKKMDGIDEAEYSESDEEGQDPDDEDY